MARRDDSFDKMIRDATAVFSGRDMYVPAAPEVQDAIAAIERWSGDVAAVVTGELVDAERVVQDALGGRGRKLLFELRPAQRQRLLGNARRGKTRTQARGHGGTPERPERAAKQPERYGEYLKHQKAMRVFERGTGIQLVTGLRQRDRSKVGKHWNALAKFLSTGDDSALRKFEGKTVGGYGDVPRLELETSPDNIEDDPDVIAGNDFESIYEDVA